MKHLIVFPTFLLLLIISLVAGGIFWLYRFSFRDFKKASTFINCNLVKFTNWYEFSR